MTITHGTLLILVSYAGAVAFGAAIGLVLAGGFAGAREDDRIRGRE